VEGKCSPDFFVILASFLLLTLCSICQLSFSSRCCRKLLFLAIGCTISHSVCFLSGLRGKECILYLLIQTSWLITKKNILRCKVSKTSEFDIILFIRHLFVLDGWIVTVQWLMLGSCWRTSKCGRNLWIFDNHIWTKG